MDRLRCVLVAASLALAASAVAAAPAAARGGNNAKARTAQALATAHGTTSQGKPLRLRLHPTGRKVILDFGFTVTCFGLSVFPYEDVAHMSGRSTPYTASGGGTRLETRVRFNFPARASVSRPTESIYGNVRIRVTGVIRVLAGTHLRATGTVQPTASLYQGGAGAAECSSGEAPITYKASSDLP